MFELMNTHRSRGIQISLLLTSHKRVHGILEILIYVEYDCEFTELILITDS